MCRNFAKRQPLEETPWDNLGVSLKLRDVYSAQGCKRDGILRDRDSKIIFLAGRDGTEIFGTAGQAKNGTKRDKTGQNGIPRFFLSC